MSMTVETFIRSIRILAFRNAGPVPPTTAQDLMVMDDDVISDARRREELRLIKMFLGITDARKRQRIIELAERLVDDAGLEDAGLEDAGLSFPPADSLPGEVSTDVSGRTE